MWLLLSVPFVGDVAIIVSRTGRVRMFGREQDSARRARRADHLGQQFLRYFRRRVVEVLASVAVREATDALRSIPDHIDENYARDGGDRGVKGW